MKATRRTFVGEVSAVIAGFAGLTPAFGAGRVLDPARFGARGDGTDDDTAALQACLDAAIPGDVVKLRQGAVYRIDTNVRPSHARFGGLRIRDGQSLSLNGAELRALPSRYEQGCIINAYKTRAWRIDGPGRIVGERDRHIGKTGEWVMGIAAWASADWTIGAGVEVSNCWGDGVLLSYTQSGRDFCENFTIDRIVVRNCRRNGISIVAGRNGRVIAPTIDRIGGTAPGAGIDLEADIPAGVPSTPYDNRQIAITDGHITNVEIGVDVSQANDGIRISGMNITARNSGIIIGQNARRVEISGNPMIKSLVGGAEGGALRTTTYGLDRSLTDIRVTQNTLLGGGQFVIDCVGDGYGAFVIDGNVIRASNVGVTGVARLGRVTFTNNDCVVEGSAGKAADMFLYLSRTTHGNNIYRNQRPFAMHSVLSHTRNNGGDRYNGPQLRAVVDNN